MSMKVLQVTPTFFPDVGGIETVVDELTNQLRLHKIDTEVAHVSTAHRKLRHELLAGKHVWRVPMIGTRLFGLAPQLRRLMNDFDVIHVHDPQLAALTANVALFKGRKPAVLSTHGGYHHTKNLAFLKGLHEHFFIQRTLAVYSVVLASSKADYLRFQRYSDRLVLCPNGVNVEKFQIKNKSSYDVRKWIYWGRLSKNKRLDRAIHCVLQARELGYEIDFLICGPDFDGISVQLNAQISAQGLETCIKVQPFLSTDLLKEELAKRSVYVTASEHEGFGLTIIEAMAAGCLIWCRDIPPLNGFVEEGTNGGFLKFDGSSEDAIQLTQILQMSENDVAAGCKASKEFAAAYDWREAVGPFIRSYQSLFPNDKSRPEIS